MGIAIICLEISRSMDYFEKVSCAKLGKTSYMRLITMHQDAWPDANKKTLQSRLKPNIACCLSGTECQFYASLGRSSG